VDWYIAAHGWHVAAFLVQHEKLTYAERKELGTPFEVFP
jgi:hypothetical protein